MNLLHRERRAGASASFQCEEQGDDVKSSNSSKNALPSLKKRRKEKEMSVLIESRLPLSHFSLTLCRKSLKSKPIKLCQIYCFPVLGRVIKYWPPILIRHGDQLFTGPQSHPLEFREFTGDIN